MSSFFYQLVFPFSLRVVKNCHRERSEAISELWGLLRRFTPRNDKMNHGRLESLPHKDKSISATSAVILTSFVS
jgi:hypothetical protein